MKKQTKVSRKLVLGRETIRRLNSDQLKPLAAGYSMDGSCNSLCVSNCICDTNEGGCYQQGQ